MPFCETDPYLLQRPARQNVFCSLDFLTVNISHGSGQLSSAIRCRPYFYQDLSVSCFPDTPDFAGFALLSSVLGIEVFESLFPCVEATVSPASSSLVWTSLLATISRLAFFF